MKLIDIFEDIITPQEYDAQKKYRYYNTLLFGGELPEIPIKFRSLKRCGGKVTFRFRRGIGITPGTLKMTLSDLYLREEQGLDKILLHEMLHVYFAVEGDFDESHGMRFQSMVRKLSSKVGFEIPLTDDVSDLTMNLKTTKPVCVVLFQRASGWSYCLLNANFAYNQQKLCLLENYLHSIKSSNFINHIIVSLVSSQTWTTISMRNQVKNSHKITSLYKLVDNNEQPAHGQAALEDALSGKILFDIE